MPERSEVPEGWARVPLIDIVGDKSDIVGGPFGSNLKVKDYQNEGIPIIRLQNVGFGEFIDKDIKFLSIKKANELKYHSFKSGDLVLAKLGTPIGKTCQIPEKYSWGIVTSDVVRIRIQNEMLDKRYLLHFLNSSRSLAQLNNQIFGTTRPRVNLKEVRDVLISFPPLPEQHRIVAAIEALFARLDAANVHLERVPGILKQFRQSVLAAACDGRLTEDWRQTSAVFECEADYIVPSRVILNHKESSPVFSRSEQKDLPYMWRYATFGSLGDWKSGATPSKSNPDFWTNGQISWVSPKDMKTEAIADSIDHITMEAVEKTNLHILPEDSLIFVVRGMILAKDFPVALTEREVTINQDMRALIPNDCVYPRYLLRALQNQAHNILRVVRSSTHGTKRLESPTLKSWPIALPPLPEQHEIVRRVDALFALADKIEAEVAAAREKTGTMRQSILAQAFSGRLVPTEAELARQEGRAYEPASVLLERIRLEKKEKKGRNGIQSTLV